MRCFVVVLAAAVALTACSRKRDECAALIASARAAHASVMRAESDPPDGSLKVESRTARAITMAAGDGNDSVRALGGEATTASIQAAAIAYADALKELGEAAHAVYPIADKADGLDRTIRGSQFGSLWATAQSGAIGIADRCKKTPSDACSYVLPRIAGLADLQNNADELTKLANALDSARGNDQSLTVDIYDFQGTLRVATTTLRALLSAQGELHVVQADVAAAQAKLDAARAREPAAEAAVEAACAP